MGREFTSREAVLPLTYCVREDGLRMADMRSLDTSCFQRLLMAHSGLKPHAVACPEIRPVSLLPSSMF
jgi:hypothetical protein